MIEKLLKQIEEDQKTDEEKQIIIETVESSLIIRLDPDTYTLFTNINQTLLHIETHPTESTTILPTYYTMVSVKINDDQIVKIELTDAYYYLLIRNL